MSPEYLGIIGNWLEVCGVATDPKPRYAIVSKTNDSWDRAQQFFETHVAESGDEERDLLIHL